MGYWVGFWLAAFVPAPRKVLQKPGLYRAQVPELVWAAQHTRGVVIIEAVPGHGGANGSSAFLCSSCVGVEEEEAPDIDIYHCPNCEKTHGKSTCK